MKKISMLFIGAAALLILSTASGRKISASVFSETAAEDTAAEGVDTASEGSDTAENPDTDAEGSETTGVPAADPTVTPTPEVTRVPGIAPDEGMISRPDHPETYTSDKLIFIGDSRTCMMRDAVGNPDAIWSCKVGMGYAWMSSVGIPQIESEIGDNTAVIVWMGVNDPDNVKAYIDCINVKAHQWAALGARTYYVALGPVTSDPYVTNAQIEAFNYSLEASLAGVTFIDVYTYLINNGYGTTDGTHYPDDVSIAVYNYIISHLEEHRSGIWG